MNRMASETQSDGRSAPKPPTSVRVAAPLALRAVMEAGIVAGLAYWGYRTGGSTLAKVLLGVGAPAVGFGVWGAVDFRSAGSLAEPLRLVEELVISGLAAGAWYASGQQTIGVALALLSAAYHALVYAIGDRLLRTAPTSDAGVRSP
jgi:Protein of unknown function (DUF2568)